MIYVIRDRRDWPESGALARGWRLALAGVRRGALLLLLITALPAMGLAETVRGPAEVQIEITSDLLAGMEWEGMWVSRRSSADLYGMSIADDVVTAEMFGRGRVREAEPNFSVGDRCGRRVGSHLKKTGDY
jgi:hypothetical protein